MRRLIVIAALLTALTAAAQPRHPSLDALQEFGRDPVKGAEGLLKYDRPNDPDVPVVVRLMIGIAYLRTGNPPAAARVFSSIVNDAAVPEGLRTLAWNGLGWTGMARGDLSAARFAFGVAMQSPGPNTLGAVAVGLIDAGDGKLEQAVETLTPVANNLRAPASLRALARYGSTLARFHAGEYVTAAQEFLLLADDPMTGVLADDARYAAGLARWRDGDRDGAIAIWEPMAAGVDAETVGNARIPRGIVRLDTATWLRMGLRRLRELPLAPQEQQLLNILDWNGAIMARTMLDRIRDPRPTDDDPAFDPAEEPAEADAADRGPAVRRRPAGIGLAPIPSAEPGANGAGAGNGAAGAMPGPSAGHAAPSAVPAGSAAPAAHHPPTSAPDGSAPPRSERLRVLAVLATLLVTGGLWLARRTASAPPRT